MPETSLPAPGSVRPYAPHFSGPVSIPLNIPRKCFFCSGVPVDFTGGPPRPAPGMHSTIAASAQASSSAPTAEVRFASEIFDESRVFFSSSPLPSSPKFSMS